MKGFHIICDQKNILYNTNNIVRPELTYCL